jgi:hypothetical protein
MSEAHDTPITSEVLRPEILRSEALESEDDNVLSVSHMIFLLIGTVASISLVSAGIAMHVLHRGSFTEFSVNTFAIIPLSTLVSFSTRNIVVKLQKRGYEFLGGLVNAVLG